MRRCRRRACSRKRPNTWFELVMELLDVTIHLAFAFDIGYEIDLERARTLLPGESGALARRRRTPESIRYRPPPLRTPIDAGGMALPGGAETVQPPRAELTIFDFGAISLSVQFPLRMPQSAILALAEELAEPAPLNASARRILDPWIERLRPAVTEFEPSEISEEYVVFVMGEASALWLAEHTDWIARLVRL